MNERRQVMNMFDNIDQDGMTAEQIKEYSNFADEVNNLLDNCEGAFNDISANLKEDVSDCYTANQTAEDYASKLY